MGIKIDLNRKGGVKNESYSQHESPYHLRAD